jgi:citrate synthase
VPKNNKISQFSTGVPATESSISSIDGKNGILAYRGYSIEDLVKYASFEEVAM